MWYLIPLSTARLMVHALRRLVAELGRAITTLSLPVHQCECIGVLEVIQGHADELATSLEEGTDRALVASKPLLEHCLAPLHGAILLQALKSYQESLPEPADYELPAIVQLIATGLEPARFVPLPDAFPDGGNAESATPLPESLALADPRV